MPMHHRGNDMTDTPTPADGWYPDPAGSGGLRRWNGTAWTDEVRPATAAPEAPAAPSAPETIPVASSAAPEAPVTPSAPAYPGAPAYPAAPAYAAAPAAPAPARADIPTNTVWIWLAVALPLLSVVALFLFDWTTYVQESIYASAFPEQAPYLASSSLVVTAGTSAFSFVVIALTVLFSFLDWRQLRARGIQKPFHWAWSFTVLAISSVGVYVIGRAVVLRRQTGKGLGPVWGWIAVTLVTIIAASIWVVMLFNAIIPIIEQLQYTSGY